MKPRISVVIPAFNEEKRILKCISSLQKQSFPKDLYEIIVVDNNSTDSTAVIAKKAGVIVLHCDQKGVSATRQFGVNQAKSDIIAFTDADSFVPVDWVNKIEIKMQDRTLMLLAGKVMPDTKDSLVLFLFEVVDKLILVQQWFGKVLPWGLNMVVRKEAMEQIGGFDPEIESSEDWDISLRIQKQFGKHAAVYSSDILAFTSNRKQEDKRVFLKYMWDGVINYANLVVLGRKNLRRMRTVR